MQLVEMLILSMMSRSRCGELGLQEEMINHRAYVTGLNKIERGLGLFT